MSENIKDLAVKIANLSAYNDNGIWWGHDTDLGDLSGKIERLLKDYFEKFFNPTNPLQKE